MRNKLVAVVLIPIALFLILGCGGSSDEGTDSVSHTTRIDGAPTVSSVTPAAGSVNVSVDTAITVAFNESMDIPTITTDLIDTSCRGSIQVSSNDFSTCVQMSLIRSMDRSRTFFSLSPASNLSNNTLYQARITTAANDLDGHALAQSFGWSFTAATISGSVDNGRIPDTGQTTSYTDTFGEDSDYSINAPSYSINGDGTATDLITGLIWQREDDDTQRAWTDAMAYCSGLSLAGYSDWRLPGKRELLRIVNCETDSPTIDGSAFPNTDSMAYWTSTVFAADASLAWYLHFNTGYANETFKTTNQHARCVRGGESSTVNLTDNGNGTVSDNQTELVWANGEVIANTWESALIFCESFALAGADDWRLPNYKELESLADDGRSEPAVDAAYFPDVVGNVYWTSTTYSGNSAWVYGVEFGNGRVTLNNSKLNSKNVRCVRGGQ